MTESSLAYLPTLQQLLETEVMAEAHVLSGENLNQRHISQVVSKLTPAPRPHSLLVARPELILAKEHANLGQLAGVVLLGLGNYDAQNQNHPSSNPAISLLQPVINGSSAATFPVLADLSLQRLQTACSEMHVPLVVLPSFGEPTQLIEEIRNAFLREVRVNTSKLHALFLKVALAEGLEALVEQVSSRTGRPIAVETATFQILASRNMGATPAGQQQTLTEAVTQALYKLKQHSDKEGVFESSYLSPLKVGRRLVLPILLDGAPVGFISAMTKANENLELLGDYLQPAAAAATVDFYQRQKDGAVFTVTQKSLLKDVLSGRGLSAADQERFERHYGFDLCDGLLVFAIGITTSDTVFGTTGRSYNLTEDALANADVEGTRIFVLPYNQKDGKTWQQIAEELKVSLKKRIVTQIPKSDPKIQIGAGRLTPNIHGLAEAYREARQSLIIGNMLRSGSEFITGYEDLGIKRLLYLMIDHPELQRFYEENLAPLESYDLEWESELVPSLRVYLEQGYNLNSAARALFIHRHTLRYRLEQIADILKVDIDSQEILLNLHIAFLIGDMKHGTQDKVRT
jgi:sugar diacid utilization regulator